MVKTRIIKKTGSKYFGPYSDAGAVNDIIDLLNRIYRLKRCAAVKISTGTQTMSQLSAYRTAAVYAPEKQAEMIICNV